VHFIYVLSTTIQTVRTKLCFPSSVLNCARCSKKSEYCLKLFTHPLDIDNHSTPIFNQFLTQDGLNQKIIETCTIAITKASKYLDYKDFCIFFRTQDYLKRSLFTCVFLATKQDHPEFMRFVLDIIFAKIEEQNNNNRPTLELINSFLEIDNDNVVIAFIDNKNFELFQYSLKKIHKALSPEDMGTFLTTKSNK